MSRRLRSRTLRTTSRAVRRAARWAAFVVLLTAAVVPAAARAEPPPNPYLDAAGVLFDQFRYEEALAELERARGWPGNTREHEVRIAMLEGIAAAELADKPRALAAFRRALAFDREAALTVTVSPKVQELFRRAQRELGAGAGSPPAPATRPAGGRPGAAEGAPPPAALRASPSPPRRPGLAWRLSGAAVGDVLGPSVGGAVAAGVRYRALEAAAGVMLGEEVGLTLEAGVLLGAPALGVSAGAILMAFPRAQAVGGGPLVGLRVGLGAGLGLVAETGVLWFHADPGYRGRPWIARLGLTFDTGARRGRR